MKKNKIIPLILLMFPLATAQAATITINSASRTIVAEAPNGPNGTNYSTPILGSLQASFQDSYTYSADSVFPGTPTHTLAVADQSSSVNLSSGVLSITGSGDANALSAYDPYQEWYFSQTESDVTVNFVVNGTGPVYYSISASLSPAGYTGWVELRQNNAGLGSVVVGIGDWPGLGYSSESSPKSLELAGELTQNSSGNGYNFNARVGSNGADTNTFAVQNGHFEFTFTVSPVPPISFATSSGGLALRWPASATSVVLEATTNISDSASWAAVTNGAVIVGDMSSVTIDTTQQPSQFFRLKTTQP